ncbi:MAG: cobalamin-dependent protein [Eggerthellaceae bacterium]|nr:cobalamin-dependent protein [Eggerthellaceae bacterium]
MNNEKMLEDIKEAILEADPDEVIDAIDTAMKAGVPATDILGIGITDAMTKVGELWQAKEFYLPDVMAAADVTRRGAEFLKNNLDPGESTSIGTVVIGTVKGDVHNVGKDLVATFMSATGFDVYNLGEDVPADVFLDAVREHDPDIVAMSCFATNVTPVMAEITSGLVELGVRDKTYCMIGGIAMGPEWVDKVGADIYTPDAYAAAQAAKAYVESR